MSKYLFYLIWKLTMTTEYEDEDNKLDKILLIARRIFIILFILVIVWIVLFKIIWIWWDKWISITWDTSNITWDIHLDANWDANVDITDANENIENLWKNYTKVWSKIYYKWDLLAFVNVDDFYVIDQDGRYSVNWTVVNSDNLLKVFANYNTRSWMMNHIDDIIKNEKNTTSELKGASENGMYKMKTNYTDLAKFDRNDRYDMTDQQRAKFAIMFLYIKILKSADNNEISMKTALNELKYFLENFDKNDLKDEIEDSYTKEIKGDIWMDKHCIYVDWDLYACFLDKIFLN